MNTANKLRLTRSLGWLMVAAVVMLSLVRLPETNIQVQGGDKLLHLCTYWVLSYWFFHVYPNKTWHIIIGFVLLGTVLEFLQSLTPYRYLEWLDWVMNVTGVLLGWVTFHLLKIQINFIRP